MLEAVTTKIVIKRSEEVKQTTSGIILQRDVSEQVFALVMSVGPDVKADIKVGDKLVVDWRNIAQTKVDGENYYIVDITGVLAIARD